MSHPDEDSTYRCGRCLSYVSGAMTCCPTCAREAQEDDDGV